MSAFWVYTCHSENVRRIRIDKSKTSAGTAWKKTKFDEKQNQQKFCTQTG